MISKYINSIKKVTQPDNCIIAEITQINIHKQRSYRVEYMQ